MSYAGTYTPCPHDGYAPNCKKCVWENGGKERYEKHLRHHLSHPDDAKSIQIEVGQVTVYSARCPNVLCNWNRLNVRDIEKLQESIQQHINVCKKIANDWDKGTWKPIN